MRDKRRTIKSKDIISGAEGACYLRVNGNNELMFYLKNLEATIKKNKKEIPVLGQSGKKHKAGGWSGSGKMTLYYVTTLFRKMVLKYIKEGIDTYFEIMIENEDPSSDAGKQTVLLKGVNLDDVIIARLDIEKEELDEDVNFTFEDVDILDEFQSIDTE